MSKVVWYRTRRTAEDEIALEIKRWGWPKGWDMSYYLYASYRSRCNKLEADIVATVQKLQSQISLFAQAEAMLATDLKAAKKNSTNIYGLSEPRRIPMKELLKYGDQHEKPDSSVYHEALNKQWLAKQGLGNKKKPSNSERPDSNSRPLRGTRTTYTTISPDLVKEYNLEIRDGEEVDSVISYKDQKKSSSGNKSGKKQALSRIREENPYDSDRWESQKEWSSWVQEQYNDADE